MIFGIREKNPQVMMKVGMASLALALVWPTFLPITGGLGSDAVDGIRGVLFGVSIALNLLVVRMKRSGNGR